MNVGRLLASLIFSLTLSGAAHAQEAGTGERSKLRGFAMSHNFSFDGVSYTYRLSTSDLVNTPSWDPLKDEPPVPLRKALEVAAVNLSRFVKGADVWDVGHINLRQLDREKWIYEITFECKVRECVRSAGTTFPILLKMDGSVVEPEVAPQRPPDEPAPGSNPNKGTRPPPQERPHPRG